MSQPTPVLLPEADLYAALRRLGLGPKELPALIAAAAPETAARLRAVDQGLLRAVLRAGTGEKPVPGADRVIAHLAQTSPVPVLDPDPRSMRTMALPSNGEIADMPSFSDPRFDDWFATQGVECGIGLYGEDRHVYRAAHFADAMSGERRTLHLGIDLFAPAGLAVHAPLPGRVHSVCYNADPLDYGHTLILAHDLPGGGAFYTLYGHLGASLPDLCRAGDAVAPGQVIAHLGDWPENGGWAPHLHFQIITDLLDQHSGNFFGVGHRSLWDIWSAISPDPNLILRLGAHQFHN
ncbi:peptidoglycan DD-metalloendopeptidase family protein [Szabonella alba]|uniref:Peptidoglycan DD-metalloendopeptidase family protein n=1 Tax=Szabonella alba TaxID=2804194 RepID=A0A8K0VAX7_9RHOB|nr:peptidoglycan DD-metalloendopeptidase family protein [Szabonella alba]MBL4915805.1 peptidoglycan DD-metalloendopeptidase family protein [Szabonella alba]